MLLQVVQPFLVAHFKQTLHHLFLVAHTYETLQLEVHHLFVNICNASPLSLFSLLLCTPLLSFLEWITMHLRLPFELRKEPPKPFIMFPNFQVCHCPACHPSFIHEICQSRKNYPNASLDKDICRKGYLSQCISRQVYFQCISGQGYLSAKVEKHRRTFNSWACFTNDKI